MTDLSRIEIEGMPGDQLADRLASCELNVQPGKLSLSDLVLLGTRLVQVFGALRLRSPLRRRVEHLEEVTKAQQLTIERMAQELHALRSRQ